MQRYLLIIIAILVTLILSELMIEWHDWNKQQDCLGAGGRNCTKRIDLPH